MIKLDFTSENDLTVSLEKMISCLLPHENFSSIFFSNVVGSLNSLFNPKELPLDYRVLIELINQVTEIRVVVKDYTPNMSRDWLDGVLTASVKNYIMSNVIDTQNWTLERGTACNLQNPEDVDHACVLLYNAVLDLYDRCFSLAVSSQDYPTLLVTLKNAFKSNANYTGIVTLSQITNEKVYIGGRRYQGYEDSLRYMESLPRELEERLRETEDSNTLVIDSIEKITEMREMNKVQTEKIMNYGIPQLDDFTPVLRSRLVVVAGQPNVGKTLFACAKAAECILSGHRVLYMCGETTRNKINNMITSHYIFKKFGKYVSSSQISGAEECCEEVSRLINIASIEIVESRNLVLQKSFHYETVYSELAEIYNDPNRRPDLIIIDHSASLRTKPNGRYMSAKERIDTEVIQLRDFKNDYPVCIMLFSHMSTEASSDLKKYGVVLCEGTCRDSSIADKEADELFLLYTNETLQAQDMIAFQVKKRRDREPPKENIFLKLNKIVMDFEYKDEYQAKSEEDISKEQALLNLKRTLGGTNDSDAVLDEIDILDDDDGDF